MSDELVPAARVAAMSNDIAEIKGTLKDLTAAVNRLAVIEERQQNTKEALERAFSTIAKIDGRVSVLEQAQPLQKQSTDWVNKVIGLVVAAVVGATVSTVVVKPQPAPAAEVVRK